MLRYKGYEAVVEYDDEAKIMHGDVLHLNDVITFEADCVADIEQAFHDSVVVYFVFSCDKNRTPEKPYSGKIPLRMPPELHREIAFAARKRKTSINKFIVQAIESYTTKQL